MHTPTKLELGRSPAGVVSVLIALYNHENTVERTLTSLLQSDCRRIELIISDDASTDDSFIVAKRWVHAHASKFKYAELYRQPQNLGINGNLNFLRSVATGDYITLLASDDALTPQAIDVQARFLDEHPQFDFVFFNCALIDEKDQIILSQVVSDRRARWLSVPPIMLFDVVVKFGLPWTRLFGRRGVFESFGKYDSDLLYEDRWSSLRIAQMRRFAYVHHVVHLYRIRRGGGWGGIQPAKLVRDCHAVERAIRENSVGFFRLLLSTRLTLGRAELPEVSGQRFWAILRRVTLLIHRLLIGR